MSTWRPEVRAQLRLALPVVVVQVGLMAMGIVDSLFMGRVSATEFAAVTLGHTYTFMLIAFGMGLLTALDPIVSQAWGARDHVAITRGVQRGILLALVLSLPIALAFLTAEPVLERLDQDPDVVPVAAAYSVVATFGVPAFLVFVVLRTALQAMHLLRPLVLVILLANGLNVLLDWALIFGHLGCPAMGAVGSSWATTISRWALTLFLVVIAWPALRPHLRHLDPRLFVLRPLGRVVRLGLPVGLQFFIEVGAFSVISLMMGRLGADELAGHQVALGLASLTFMVPLGISMAASVRVGNAVGREDAPGVRRAAAVSLLGGAVFMAFAGAVFLTLPHALARVFTPLPEVLAVAGVLIPLAGLFQVFDGIQVVAVGVLRGIADMRVPMLIHLAGFWGVAVPLAAYLAFWRDGGPVGLWWGLASGLAAVALVQGLRVRSRLSGSIARLVIDEEGTASA